MHNVAVVDSVSVGIGVTGDPWWHNGLHKLVALNVVANTALGGVIAVVQLLTSELLAGHAASGSFLIFVAAAAATFGGMASYFSSLASMRSLALLRRFGDAHSARSAGLAAVVSGATFGMVAVITMTILPAWWWWSHALVGSLVCGIVTGHLIVWLDTRSALARGFSDMR